MRTSRRLWTRPLYVVNSSVYVGNLLAPGHHFHGAYEHLGDAGRAWNHPIGIYRRVNSTE